MLDSVSAILYAMKDDLPIVLKLGRGNVEHCVGVPFPILSGCRRENNLLVAAKPSRRMLDSGWAAPDAMKDDVPIVLKLRGGILETYVILHHLCEETVGCRTRLN